MERKTDSSRHETSLPVSYKASIGGEPKETATKGRAGRKMFFVEQIAVEIIAQRAAEKIEPGDDGGRHSSAAAAVSFTVKKNWRWEVGRSTVKTPEEPATVLDKQPTEIVAPWQHRPVETSVAEVRRTRRVNYWHRP
jgi:hypothetical protein